MDKVYVKGQKLFITTDEATYDGTFHSMDDGRNRLTVKDVVKHPSEESFDGIFHFYRAEILNVQIMDPLASAWLTPGTEIVGNKNSSIMRGCQASSIHKYNVKHFGNNELPKEKYNYYLNLLKKFKIIDNVDDEFDQAVAEIKKQSLIGISFEGAQFGRKGKLSWLSICCPVSPDPDENGSSPESNGHNDYPSRVIVYLFDVALMGNVAFSKGLGDILQGKHSPAKVIHDCRLPSDCLFHQFDVRLENVLDTQVGEAIMHHPRTRLPDGKDLGPMVFTRSLHHSLTYTLGLPPNLIFQPQIHDGYLQRHLDIWFQRPITSLMAKAATFQSIYLINLWNRVQFVEPTETFKIGIKIYLSCVRDADDETAFLMTNYYNLVPEEFIPHLLKSHEKAQPKRRRFKKKVS